jgi:hypothetical protein
MAVSKLDGWCRRQNVERRNDLAELEVYEQLASLENDSGYLQHEEGWLAHRTA